MAEAAALAEDRAWGPGQAAALAGNGVWDPALQKLR